MIPMSPIGPIGPIGLISPIGPIGLIGPIGPITFYVTFFDHLSYSLFSCLTNETPFCLYTLSSKEL